MLKEFQRARLSKERKGGHSKGRGQTGWGKSRTLGRQIRELQ